MTWSRSTARAWNLPSGRGRTLQLGTCWWRVTSVRLGCVSLLTEGRSSTEEARAAFAEQVKALIETFGVDLIVIETMSDLYEIREAIKAAHEVGAQHAVPLPVIAASVTFTRDDRTLLGDDPMKVAREN